MTLFRKRKLSQKYHLPIYPFNLDGGVSPLFLEIVMHIGSCVQKAHEKTGILRKTVADQIGMDRPNYSHLLSRENMLVSTFHNVCQGLGMTMDEVLKLNESSNG